MAEEARAEGKKPDADRTPVYRQLWFCVVIAIVLGIAFGLLFEKEALKAQWLAADLQGAGITGAGLVTLTASLQAFGGDYFSAQSIAVGIALVVGIDRIMSEGRALTNAIGNSVATMVIAKWMGELDEEKFAEALRSPTKVERATDRALAGAAA